MSCIPSSNYGHTELIRCILEKNIEGTITLIENDTDLNETDIHGFSPLMYAIRQRLFQVTNYLIAKGCDVNKQNRAMETALHLVVKGYYRKPKGKDDWIKFMEILLENGADANLTERRGFSPLMWAIKHSQSEMVAMLIKAGANVNIYNERIEQCLHIAVKTLPRNTHILQLLISNGAEVNGQDFKGFPPLMWAVKNNTYDMVAMLIKAGADVNLPNYYSDRCLHIAVRSPTPNMEVIECLLSNGADCNVVDRDHKSPLVRSMEGRINEKSVCTQIATKLINSGCDIDPFTFPFYKMSIIIHALEQGLDDFFSVLDSYNDSAPMIALFKAPIIHALDNGQDDVALLLMEKGCNVNVVDAETERSVLWFAFKNQSIKILISLLEIEANPNEFFLEEIHKLGAIGSIPSANMLTAMIKYGLRTDALPDHDKYPGLLCYILMERNYAFEDITYLFDLLYTSGSCTQKQLFLLLDDPQMLNNFQSVPKKRDWIIQKCSQPLTLKEISRIHVLKNWEGYNLSTFINGLPIETSLRKYLTFPEFSIDEREIPDDFNINCLLLYMLDTKTLSSMGSLTEDQIQIFQSQPSLRPFWEGSVNLWKRFKDL